MDATNLESAGSVQIVDVSPSQLVTFQVGDQVYALDVRDVHEVIQYQKPEFRPGEPPWMLGVIQLRGEILPVIDARARLGLPDKAPGVTTVFVVFEEEGKRLALLVDQVLDVVQVASEGVLDNPPGLAQEDSAIRGFVRLNGRTVALLNPQAFLPLRETIPQK